MSNLPPWRNQHTFTEVMSLEFTDGSQWSDLMRVRLHLCQIDARNHILQLFLHGIHPELGLQDCIIIECIRSKAILNIFAGLTLHTEDTISHGRHEIKNFAGILAVSS